MRRSVLTILTTRTLAFFLFLTLFFCSGYTRGEKIAMHALTHLDAPYVLGKSGPEKFDCSGLARHCYRLQDVAVAHSAQVIGENPDYRRIDDPSRLAPGDILCFDTIRDSDLSDHVGIWLGNGRFVHASSGQKKVVINELKGYFSEHFTGGRRVICPYF